MKMRSLNARYRLLRKLGRGRLEDQEGRKRHNIIINTDRKKRMVTKRRSMDREGYGSACRTRWEGMVRRKHAIRGELHEEQKNVLAQDRKYGTLSRNYREPTMLGGNRDNDCDD